LNFEDFPSIEAFHKLPRKIILKAGETGFDEAHRPTLSGIVINNLGQPIRNVEVYLVLFDDQNMPVEHLKTIPEPNRLGQGTLGSFRFVVAGRKEKISNYYLHSRWEYDDKNWEESHP
jgi:hypothetical protein